MKVRSEVVHGRSLRIAVLGAFPFPLPQGSQVFAAEQVRALRGAGADALLLTYGRGCGAPAPDLPLRRSPAALSPRLFRSGLHWAKPLADVGLFGTFLRAHRQRRFDAVLAHNAEGAWIALAARPLAGVPVVYVAHTLWQHELPSYGPRRLGRLLGAWGRAIDQQLARHADACIGLCETAARVLRAQASGPVELIPPGHHCAPPPDPRARAALCARLGLEVGRFALYTGNLDSYQNLGLLSRAAKCLPPEGPPLVVATHDARSAAKREAGLRCIALDSFEQMRTLTFAAGVLVLPRTLQGGFPVKLLNYLEAGRPIVAFAEVAAGLAHDPSTTLLPAGAGPERLAADISGLLEAADRVVPPEQAARNRLAEEFAWPDLARRTLALVQRVLRS